MIIGMNLFVVRKPVDEGLVDLLYEMARQKETLSESMKVGDMYISGIRLFESDHPLIQKQHQDLARLTSALLHAPVKIYDSWYHIYRSGSAFKRHRHLPKDQKSDVHFSMAYYLDRGDDNGSGQLKMYDPDILVSPRTAMIVVFPADADHEVLEYRGEKDRIMLGCNLVLRRAQ